MKKENNLCDIDFGDFCKEFQNLCVELDYDGKYKLNVIGCLLIYSLAVDYTYSLIKRNSNEKR